MVDVYDSMEPMENSDSEKKSCAVVQSNDDAPQQTTSPTTTISTIAVQSGETRLVIALLQSGEWLRLKVLEVQPELTKLGASVDEATQLSNAHDEVLLRLQSKQSPVEELLKQADQLISTQRPRAEVYAAMAETLGQAWRDVNELLERRKQILDCNVLFQCRSEECRESMRALEMACNDTLLPIEIEAVKNFLSKIHDLRKNMLEALMGALQEGKSLLDRLREIANEGTLDSRPDRIKVEADHAVLKVERWLEELHDRRRLIEASFRSRKTQLEQCLALALLATDLRDLEEILNDRIAALSSSCDQLGDSASSAELLLFELRKLQTESKEFQDRSIKITKSTEKLVSSGHFAGEQATEQAYVILGAAADYVNDLDQYEALLNRAVAFFDLARSALTKLDQLEIQLVTTEHPPYSPRLARFHAQTVATIEDVTSKPLMEGYALLDVTGRGAPGAEGVKRTVEELENRKICLMERCTAHEAENLEISRIINTFLEKHEELRRWLITIPEAFLQGHQDMGSDKPMAEDFCQLHKQLLTDLEKRTDEIEHLEFEILPIRDRLEGTQRREFETNISELKHAWNKTKKFVIGRINLGSLYLQFHLVADELIREIDAIERDLKRHADALDEAKIDELGKKWKELQPLYLKLNATGNTFLDAANEVDDPYLDVPRARLCVQTVLEKFANRQLTVTESWEKWRTTIEILRERRVEHEQKIEESTRTIEWVSKFSEQLYPVITCQSTEIFTILQDLHGSKSRILPQLYKAVDELDNRIKSINSLVQKGEAQLDEEILRKLLQMHENLRTTARDYEALLGSLISIFENIENVERKIDQAKIQADRITSCRNSIEVDTVLTDLEATRRSVFEQLNQISMNADDIIKRINQQEPPEAAAQDIDKLKRFVENVTSNFEIYWSHTTKRIDEHKKACTFSEDLDKINSNIRDLDEHLKNVDIKIGENLQAAKSASSTFTEFEKTITILEERIETFIKTTEETIVVLSPPRVDDISSLNESYRNLKGRMEETRKRVNLCIDYFVMLEEVKEWCREGSKLLVVVARKATAVKVPKDATDLLEEIDEFLKPGEEIQDKRIEKLKELSIIVFGTNRLLQFNEVVAENRQMLDSFAIVSSELRTLAQNLKNAEDLREKLRLEKEEADEKLNAAKVEMAAAEAAREEAEKARQIAEKLAAETLEKAAIEAQKLKEEREAQKLSVPPSFSVSAQTEKIETTDESFIQETITSAITTKEIHILQKTEIERTVPVVQREPSPQKTVNSNELQEQSTKEITKEEELPVMAPEFTISLSDATVQEGEKFTFECQLVGQPLPEIVWYKDGISILNNPDYLTTFVGGLCTLTIEETFAEDSAEYTCRAFNIAGSAETVATLTVKETTPEEQPSPPVFVKELISSLAVEGSSHRMECVVEGTPLPTVQWYKNDTNIDNSPDYVITYNNGEAVLKFEEVFLEDKATYTCKATNPLGYACTSAFLDIESLRPSTEKPYFVTPLSNAMARAGQRVKLECEASGTPMPQFIWNHDGRIIEETPHIKIQTDGGCTSLLISEAFPKDAGCYTVTAKNDAGEATVSSNVSVKGRLPHESSDSEMACSDLEPVVPKIQLPLRDITVQEGRSARLDCIIIGQPEPEVIWYREDQPVKESADFQLLFQGDKCSLVIHEAFLDDAGVYKVVAINSGGEASSQCTLTVTPVSVHPNETDKEQKNVEEVSIEGLQPKFIKLPTDSLVAEGEEAIFECAVTGEPNPELRWYLDSTEIVPNERVLIEHKEDGTCILRITTTVPEDKGNYTAKASNTHGEAKAFARLVVRSLGDFRRKEDFVQMEEKLIAPSFKERFEDRSVPEGITTTFECIVIGKPTPKIQWLFNERPVHGKDFLVSVSGDRQVLTIPETGSTHAGTISCAAENTAGKAICSARLEIGDWPTGEKEEPIYEGEAVEKVYELVESLPTDEMHPSKSSEKHFSAEKSGDGSSDSQVLTRMSQTITESSTTHTTMKKEFVSEIMSASHSASGQEPTSVSTKTIIESSEHATSENGGPPVVQSHKVEEYEKVVQDRPGEIRQERTVVVSQDEEGIKRGAKTTQLPKTTRKSTSPRFISPVTGMIVDQGTDVVLEGIIDGFPQPVINWCKNGQELKPREDVKISYAHNHVRLELQCVSVKDAGRYTCSASNEVGSASSTADLVVKKTIFPPVFGRRLQAQVAKRGDRVNMEVEITGTPEPTVSWFKNDIPVKEKPPEIRMKQQGNCYLLIIDRADKEHAGKYMVRASNAGGEAQSIADFAVFEPTPETMVEVHKTVIYEDLHNKKMLQPGGRISDLPSAKLTTEQFSTTTIQPGASLKTTEPHTQPLPTIRSVQTVDQPHLTSSRSETISSTVESHKTEMKSEQKYHMKLEHKTPPIPDLKPFSEQKTTTRDVFREEFGTRAPMTEQKTTVKEVIRESVTPKAPMAKSMVFEEQTTIENENVETSTIAKKDALSFFESMTKETEMTPKGPKGMIKLVDDTDSQGREIKVGQLTKNYERTTTYQEVKKPEIKSAEATGTKKAVQDLFSKFEQGSTSRGIDNKLFEFPYESYKLPLLDTKRTVLEDTTPSGHPIDGALTISKLEAQSESAEAMMTGFNLVPEPPPEIGYMPKPEEMKKKRPEVSIKAKQLQESFDKTLSPIDAPIGGVKIFPTLPPKTVEPPKPTPPSAPTFSVPPPFELERKQVIEETCIKKDVHEKKESKYFKEEKIQAPKTSPTVPIVRPVSPSRPWSSSSDLETRSHVSTDLSEYRCHSAASSHHETLRSTSPRPSADGLAMEKSWAKKCAESTRKSWPPPGESTPKYKQEWQVPTEDYKTSTKESKHEVQEIPGGIKKTSMESSSTVEKRSWSSKDEMSENITESIPSPMKVGPIIYNAETIKVDHTINKMEEKSLFEKYTSERDMHKTESTEKMEQFSTKTRWTGADDLKAPSLVKNIEVPKIPVDTPKMYQSMPPPEPFVLEPGPPIEIGYIPAPIIKEKKIERIEKTFEVSIEQQPPKIPPGAVKIIPPPLAPKKEEPPALPPKDVRKSPPPLPAKTPSVMEKLEPFPFDVSSAPPAKPTTMPAPPTPSRFVKGSFGTESDYESDMDSHLRAKWRPYESDNDEPRYRKVQPPVPKQANRPRSTDPEPLPPSRFEVPPEISGPSKVTSTAQLDQEDKTCKKTMVKRYEREFKQQQKYQVNEPASIELKPGSPPIYVQSPVKSPTPKSPTIKKPESPKFKTKSFQQESGYMADTDEPLQQKASNTTMQKSFGKHESSSSSSHMESRTSYSESRSEYFESKSYESHQQLKKDSSFSPSVISGTSQTPKPVVQQQRSTFLDKSYMTSAGSAPSRYKTTKETMYSTDEARAKMETIRKTLAQTASPSKFVKGEFRESDYESDYDGRIPPLWKPRGYESDDQGFRPVNPNVAGSDVASRHMTDMTSTFKSKTEKFVSDIQSDLKQSKPILKHPADSRTNDADEPRTYREESRVAEHGTKQIDPDTGLIYFKYDFGYEFGIVLPGEGKKTISNTNRTIQGQRRASDIEVPIVHEFTTRKENGYPKRNISTASSRGQAPNKFSKTVKWEPTSESEISEAEDTRNARKRHSIGGVGSNTMSSPPSLVIPCSPSPSRWDHTTPSPLSLSPSLPSLSPRYSSATGPPSNVDSAGSPWPTTNGVASSKEVIQPYLDILPKKAPLFITPLRDIAVVSGQSARFECIVQAEPPPNILWSKDGRIVENSSSHEIYYRNGVCRLTLVRAFPEDAGTYACTATNSLGSTVTSATLQVPGNRRSVYAPL